MQENSVFQYLFRMCAVYINASSEEFKTKHELHSSIQLICRVLCHDVSWWIITCKAITIKLSTWGLWGLHCSQMGALMWIEISFFLFYSYTTAHVLKTGLLWQFLVWVKEHILRIKGMWAAQKAKNCCSTEVWAPSHGFNLVLLPCGN